MSTDEAVVPYPLYEQVAERIRQAIVDGRFSPGDPLPTERELSDRFAVSRTSVREALRQLEARGLIVGGRTSQGRTIAEDATGTLVRAVADALLMRNIDLEELIDLRCAVEVAALRRAAEVPDAEHLTEARTALEVMRDADVDDVTFDAVDVRFHGALVAASGNRAMRAVMRATRETQTRYLAEALASVRDASQVLAQLADEHAEILGAVEAGDGNRAAILVERHIRDFYRRGSGSTS